MGVNKPSNFDITFSSELFTIADKANKLFLTDFIDSKIALERILNNIQSEDGFKGKACFGFVEIFEILLMYHNDLILEFPDLYKAFSDQSDKLAEIDYLNIMLQKHK
ncbi:MAG: hypothetical protein RR646_04820 [Erysipelotrichaceae bacterium]